MRSILLFVLFASFLGADEKPVAQIDGTGAGWADLTSKDFVNINCKEDTWKWEGNNASCSGQPVGVIATQEVFTNFELSLEWKHHKPAGNSGVFVWGIPEILTAMKEGDDKRLLPAGIEVQVLDLAYKTNYEKKGKVATWFTCHGDVFAVGEAKLTPFPPLSPNGSRSFPTAETTRPHGEWNHYYIRCLNGDVRLWVNGKEVSGGNQASPASGQICLESEGSPIDFRNLRIRVLP
ncbi:MAG: 3-keto-disaccharide hydrolase [Roseibacillus sp.]